MVSATDIVHFLACRRLGVLKQEAAAGKREKPFFKEPSQELLRELGIRHEQNYLSRLQAGQSLSVVQIPEALSWPEAVRETTKALLSGADIVSGDPRGWQLGWKCGFLGEDREARSLGFVVLRSGRNEACAIRTDKCTAPTLFLFRNSRKNPRSYTRTDACGVRRLLG